MGTPTPLESRLSRVKTPGEPVIVFERVFLAFGDNVILKDISFELRAGYSKIFLGASGAGKSTYDSVCMACHSTGVAGAPKLGDKAAWAPRVKQGKDALYNSALKGKGAMPAKGGNASLSDDAVKAAVDYMVSAAQ